jgi:hypothetical protein
LGFQKWGNADFDGYLMAQKEHWNSFEFATINSVENYSGVYIQVQDIENVYNNFLNNGVAIHPNGPWKSNLGQKRIFDIGPRS